MRSFREERPETWLALPGRLTAGIGRGSVLTRPLRPPPVPLRARTRGTCGWTGGRGSSRSRPRGAPGGKRWCLGLPARWAGPRGTGPGRLPFGAQSPGLSLAAGWPWPWQTHRPRDHASVDGRGGLTGGPGRQPLAFEVYGRHWVPHWTFSREMRFGKCVCLCRLSSSSHTAVCCGVRDVVVPQ